MRHHPFRFPALHGHPTGPSEQRIAALGSACRCVPTGSVTNAA